MIPLPLAVPTSKNRKKPFKYSDLTACLELACPERLQLYKMIKADIVDIVATIICTATHLRFLGALSL